LKACGRLGRRRVMRDDLVRLVSERLRRDWLALMAECEMSDVRDFIPLPEPNTQASEHCRKSLDKWCLVTLPSDETLARAAASFKREIAWQYQVFPLHVECRPMKLLALWPNDEDLHSYDSLSLLLGSRVEFVVADRDPQRNAQIVQRLIDQHFPVPEARDEVTEPKLCRLGQEPAAEFLEGLGEILESSDQPGLVHLFALIASDVLTSGAVGLDIGPVEERIQMHQVWGSQRVEIVPPPVPWCWPLAFTILAALGMDVCAAHQPQTAQTEVQVKNGTVRIEATAEPTPFSPRFTLTLHRRFPVA